MFVKEEIKSCRGCGKLVNKPYTSEPISVVLNGSFSFNEIRGHILGSRVCLSVILSSVFFFFNHIRNINPENGTPLIIYSPCHLKSQRSFLLHTYFSGQQNSAAA